MAYDGPSVESTAGQLRLKELGIKPIPSPDEDTRPYWEAATQHRLSLLRCTSCSHFRHPPKEACTVCGATEGEWVTVSGDGTIYSFIVDHRNMVPGFEGAYVVAIVNPVEGDEDVRIVANIRNCPIEDVSIGMPVKVLFEDVAPGVTLPQFEPRVLSDANA
jgi:uncharacterized OB-fold protein